MFNNELASRFTRTLHAVLCLELVSDLRYFSPDFSFLRLLHIQQNGVCFSLGLRQSDCGVQVDLEIRVRFGVCLAKHSFLRFLAQVQNEFLQSLFVQITRVFSALMKRLHPRRKAFIWTTKMLQN